MSDKRTPNDISMRAIRLGRCLDRLPAGKYVISLDKSSDRMDWVVDVSKTVQELNLGDFYENRNPENGD
jgi:hypothetical protein